MQTTESEHLSQVLSSIYDAALAPETWPEALEGACAFLDGAAANIFWQDPVAQSAMVFHAWNDNAEFVESYVASYAKLNPFFPAITFIDPGIVFSGGDIIPHDEFQKTRFFLEWVAPQDFIDVVGVNLYRFSTSAACFSVRRNTRQGIVDDAMRRRMALIAPHVRRAVMIGREIDRQKAMSTKLSAILDSVTAGAFLVDAAGRVDFANESGQALLADGAVLRLRDGLLTAIDRPAHVALRATLATTALGTDVALGPGAPSIVLTSHTGERYLAHILPLSSGARQKASLGYSATAAIFVRRAEIPVVSGVEAVARSHGLTPSEIRVLQAVGSGGSVREIADALGVSSATVKTHLASIFRRTGARRRSDLVRQIASHGNPL